MQNNRSVAGSHKVDTAKRRARLSVMLVGLLLCGCAAPPMAGSPTPAPSQTPFEPAAIVELQVIETPVPTAIPTPTPEPLPFSII